MIGLRELAHALGGEVAGRQVLAPGPYHSAKDRSLSVWPCATAPDGFLATSHAGDDWRTCRDHVKARIGLPLGRQVRDLTPEERAEWAARRREAEKAEQAERQRRIALARGVLDGTIHPADDPAKMVQRYLRRRGLDLTAEIADVLRYHPACPWKTEDGRTIRVPAMIAPMRDIRTNEVIGVHRTVLDSEARKVGRRMLGIATGACVKLDPDSAVTTGLTIGEGIETVLTARVLKFRPAWAMGSVGQVAAFPVLPGIEALTILEEIDAGASRRAVDECGERWTEAGREVRTVLPKTGSDLNDAIREIAA